MRRVYWLPALLLGLWAGLLAIAPAPADDKKPDAEKIQKLIDQLGSDTFEDRQKAVKELDAIGEPALELLRKAVKDGEPEVRKRAEELVKKIEKATEQSRVLAATRVHLVFKDTPVADAVAEIQKKTGYNIYLHDPEEKLKDRKVTLDTGATTFWGALEQFCQKAGLAEANVQDMMVRPVRPVKPVPPVVNPPPPEKPKDGAKQDEEARQARAAAAAADEAAKKAKVAEEAATRQAKVAAAAADKAVAPAQPAPPAPPAAAGAVWAQPLFPGQPGQIVLMDAKNKGKKEAADVSSAVRVKALSNSDLFGSARGGEILLVLEISPEPKLQWQQTLALRISKALDDQGQDLKDMPGEAPSDVGPRGPAAGFGGPVARPAPQLGFGGAHLYFPVRLKKGEKAAKALKELSGTVTAQLLTAPQALITADNVLKNNGKTFKGADDGSIKVLDVSKGDNGTVTVRFELEQPANIIPANGGGWGMPGGIQIMPAPAPVPARVLPRGALNAAPAQPQPVVLPVQENGAAVLVQVQAQPAIGIAVGPGGMMTAQVGYNGVALLDEKDHPVPVLVQQQVGFKPAQPGQKNALEYIFVFQLEKGQSDNVKLVFLGRKQTTVDVPFTLKDVTLP
jgi:hypothetical protein